MHPAPILCTFTFTLLCKQTFQGCFHLIQIIMVGPYPAFICNSAIVDDEKSLRAGAVCTVVPIIHAINNNRDVGENLCKERPGLQSVLKGFVSEAFRGFKLEVPLVKRMSLLYVDDQEINGVIGIFRNQCHELRYL